MTQSIVEVLQPSSARGYSTAVSLHAHTWHSKETLGFLPRWMSGVPVMGALFGRELARYRRERGRDLDFTRAYWRPPLMPGAVFASEVDQISARLGLAPLVSITDHDSVEAPLSLQAHPQLGPVPVSLEWTVPFRGSTFHVGVHNIPRNLAASFVPAMSDCAVRRDEARLVELLSCLDALDETLIVLNHPLWDGDVNNRQGAAGLEEALAALAPWIHAFEVNGYRRWQENRTVVELAARWDRPLVAGGDRHGVAANSVLNLAHGGSFEAFVAEIRVDQRSHLVIMPEYLDHATRELGAVSDILASDPAILPEHQHWAERLFTTDERGDERRLADEWQGKLPWWLRGVIGILKTAGSPPVRPMVRLALAGAHARLF